MKQLSKRVLITFAVVTLAGACLHFLYALLPGPITALISPVNESLWEHLKIMFWPLLAAALFLTHKGGKDCRGPWCLAILIACASMLALGFGYHVLLGGNSVAIDVFLYVVMMALAFLLSGILDRPAVRRRADPLTLLVLALGCAILLFTFLPPDNILFADLTRTNTWSPIPTC